MKLNFLCANHRGWLLEQPDQAIHCCANACETGWYLYHQGRWKDALPYLGCAFESAEILLSTHAMLPAIALDWFLHTLEGLTQTLKKLDLVQECDDVYCAAIARLRQEASANKQLNVTLDTQITRLTDERRQLKNSAREHSAPMPDIPLKHGAIVIH